MVGRAKKARFVVMSQKNRAATSNQKNKINMHFHPYRTLAAVFLMALFWSPASAANMSPRRLDGIADFPKAANKWPAAVMIDNHTAARPQAGLQDASIVYEALAEGGIPRFMAIFAHYGTPVLGPVRSGRPYFVRYASEYPAAFVHAGGSPDAQELLKKFKLYNIEGIKGSTAKYFYRQGKGVSSLYIRGKSINDLMPKASYYKKAPVYRPWKYGLEASLAKRGKQNSGVRVDLGAGRNYTVEYRYDKKTNTYLRFTGGRAHTDKNTKKQIRVKNIVLLFVPKEKVLDKKGRIELQTVGTGKALLIKNGQPTNITWQKKTDRARTIFYNKGKELVFNAGNTWITIVPKGRTYKVF